MNYIAGFRSWFDMACPLRARGSPSGAEAPLGRSLSRRLTEPFVLSVSKGKWLIETQSLDACMPSPRP
ncbi:MAG: hypothetical protein Q8P64_17185 [Deltaproteobacteria bacterium]|nr:hypothetical protein [Deltaproteobacteria bacterium]